MLSDSRLIEAESVASDWRFRNILGRPKVHSLQAGLLLNHILVFGLWFASRQIWLLQFRRKG